MPSKKILVQEDYLFVPTGSNPASGAVAFYPKSDNNFYKRTAAGVESKLWDNANHGIDSGLNADMLDGNHASAFAPVSHSHSFGSLTDVSLLSPIAGQTLVFNGTSWVNNPSILCHSGTEYISITLKASEFIPEFGRTEIYFSPEEGMHFATNIGQNNQENVVFNHQGITSTKLSGTGERILAADPSGVIKVATNQPGASYWETDGYNLKPKLLGTLYPGVNIESSNYFGANEFLTEFRGATLALRGFEYDEREQQSFLTADRNAGIVSFEAAAVTYYKPVASVLAVATQDHTPSMFGTQLEFWTTANNTAYGVKRMVIRQDGKVVGINGFGVFGLDGTSGTFAVLAGCSYNSATKTLVFTRLSFTVSGGIITSYAATTNINVPLS